MRPFRFLIITSALLASGLSATISSGQTLHRRHATESELSDPWSLTPWSVNSASLFLFRSDPGAKQLAGGLLDPANNAVNADDLSYGFAYGYQLRVERQLTQQTRFETRYFGTDDWDDSMSQTTNDGALSVAGLPLGVGLVGDGGSIQTQLASKLYSLELNMNHQLYDNIEGIIGFRYLRLKDNLSINAPDAEMVTFPFFPLPFPVLESAPASIRSQASNDLFGAQIGARARLWQGQRFSLTTDGKAGIYGNGAHQRTSVAALQNGNYAFANDSNDTTAFVGEWTLQGNYKLTDRWSVDVGYQLLWIDNVAVGTTQLAASNYDRARLLGGRVGAGDGIDSYDSVFYQGITLGVNYMW